MRRHLPPRIGLDAHRHSAPLVGYRDAVPASTEHSSAADLLVSGGRRWIRDALTAWHDADAAAVCLMGPQAVELLGKAVLWSTNPALLAIVTGGDNEAALIRLVRGDPLTARGLRTIGLSSVLGRLAQLHEDFPVEKGRRSRIAEVRNGAVHIGAAADEARHMLTDCLRIIDFLIGALGLSRVEFYGNDVATVDALEIDHQASVEATVQMKMARARNRLGRLEALLGSESFDETTSERERARFTIVVDEHVPGGTSTDATCPECRSTGRLLGMVEVDMDADIDFEPIGGGMYEQVIEQRVVLHLDPYSFVCRVCDLVLNGRDELAAASLRSSRFAIDEEDLDDPSLNLSAAVDSALYYDT